MLSILDYFIERQCVIDCRKRPHRTSSVDLIRFRRVGPATVLASIAGVLLVRAIAVALLQPAPEFVPFRLTPTIIDTALLVSLGVGTFKRVVGVATDPVGTFTILSTKALLLSFLPDIAVGMSHAAGATWLNAFALMAEHIVAWAVCVVMLTRLTISGINTYE